MPVQIICLLHLVLGYAAWLLCFGTYLWPRLRAMPPLEAQRAIATLHGFRFFGLAFIIPGVVGPALPSGFATFAAYGDFATGLLALLALATARVRPLFWLFVAAFNAVGMTDLVTDYYHASQLNLPAMAGQLGAVYWVPILYVPLLMITHIASVWLMVRSGSRSEAIDPAYQLQRRTPRA